MIQKTRHYLAVPNVTFGLWHYFESLLLGVVFNNFWTV